MSVIIGTETDPVDLIFQPRDLQTGAIAALLPSMTKFGDRTLVLNLIVIDKRTERALCLSGIIEIILFLDRVLRFSMPIS